MQTETQISPLSGSVKKQNIEFLGKEKIKLYNKEYDVEHFRLFSTNPNLSDDKKLNFEIWYDKKKALIIKVAYKRMGLWEDRLKKIQELFSRYCHLINQKCRCICRVFHL